jgi:hypothetical protein
MPTYKVTKVFLVDASSKPEAIAKVTDDPGELLEFVSVIEQPGSQSGWRKSVVKQLTGK